MSIPDLVDLMGIYAQRGVDDWKGAPLELRKRALACLGTFIADTQPEAAITINTLYTQGNLHNLKFIPMPKHPDGGIERCFFLPIREPMNNGRQKTAFDLFLLIKEKNCLAFRFEPADAPPSTHGYGHVQMSRTLLRRTIQVEGVPLWLHDSYPAFAIATSDPLEMFLSMTTAVHGYAGGMVKVLQDVFQKASRAQDARVYLEALKAMLE